jgi:hypothetical protein
MKNKTKKVIDFLISLYFALWFVIALAFIQFLMEGVL